MGITHHSNYIRWMEEARTVKIEVQVKEIRPVKVFPMYIMRNEMENIVATAESSHAFLNRDGRPVRLNKQFPEFYEALSMELVNDNL